MIINPPHRKTVHSLPVRVILVLYVYIGGGRGTFSKLSLAKKVSLPGGHIFNEVEGFHDYLLITVSNFVMLIRTYLYG